MPYARRYETFEVRSLLQRAEGVGSPITGVGAHSRGLHARSTPGGVGVTPQDMMHRTHKQAAESNRMFANRGGVSQTSAFANLIQQADAAFQALNSPMGQRALAVLDLPLHAARNLRLTLEVNGLREIGFLGPVQGRMNTVHKTAPQVTSTRAGAVRLIIDRAPGAANIHIQTCFPLQSLASSRFEVTDMGTRAVIARG
jgi:hypothetical protein